jgi:hypothetical protein
VNCSASSDGEGIGMTGIHPRFSTTLLCPPSREPLAPIPQWLLHVCTGQRTVIAANAYQRRGTDLPCPRSARRATAGARSGCARAARGSGASTLVDCPVTPSAEHGADRTRLRRCSHRATHRQSPTHVPALSRSMMPSMRAAGSTRPCWVTPACTDRGLCATVRALLMMVRLPTERFQRSRCTHSRRRRSASR